MLQIFFLKIRDLTDFRTNAHRLLPNSPLNRGFTVLRPIIPRSATESVVKQPNKQNRTNEQKQIFER
jgi:hypothetical protein